jgi:cytochrome c553
MKKLLKWTALLLGGLIGLILLAGLALYLIGRGKLARTYPDIPVETIAIPTDAAAIARGEHIAVIRKCTGCHGDGLSGKLITNSPLLGTVPASNLTAGKGGVGQSYSDTDWVRAIRHGVKPNSRAAVFMYNYSILSDQDLGDLIAYLKQLPPVDAEYPEMRYGPILPMAPAIGLLPPAAAEIDHSAPRPADPVPGATIEYGRYLSTICFECHSTSLASKVEDWSQEEFMRTVRTGTLPDGEPFGSSTHLETIGTLNDTELTALWLYLKSLSVQGSGK